MALPIVASVVVFHCNFSPFVSSFYFLLCLYPSARLSFLHFRFPTSLANACPTIPSLPFSLLHPPSELRACFPRDYRSEKQGQKAREDREGGGGDAEEECVKERRGAEAKGVLEEVRAMERGERWMEKGERRETHHNCA